MSFRLPDWTTDSKPKPKAKVKPKPAPKRTVASDKAIVRAARSVGATTTRAAPQVTRSVRRAVATAPRPAVDPLDAVLANLDRTRAKSPVAQVTGVRTSGPADLDRLRGRSGAGGFLANLGGDVVDTITGIPSAAQLGAENIGAAALAPAAGLSMAGVPKLGWAEDYLKRVGGLDKTAAKAIAEDYRSRYGDSWNVSGLDALLNRNGARGKLRTTLGKAYEHPGLTALDAATVFSGAGAGIRIGAKAGARVAGDSAAGARMARLGSRAITPGSARYRPDRVRTVEMGENTATGLKGRSVASVADPRRPYSANPLTRVIQRSVEGPAARVAKAVERSAEGGSRIAAPFSRQAKFNRVSARSARDYRLEADLGRARSLRIESKDYVKAVRELDRSGISDLARRGKSKWSKEQVDAAIFLHGRDLLNVPGKTPLQARDAVVKFMRDGLDEAVTKGGSKSKGAQGTIDAIAHVPDSLLDLKTAPPELRAAVEQYRKLSTTATEQRIAAGAITPETARAVSSRSAQAVFEGARYDAKSGAWTSPRNPYSPVGSKGVYTQDVPVDPLKAGRAGDVTSAFGRMTQDKVKQSHGTLFRRGNVSIDRGLPVKAFERSLVDKDHPKFVTDFYDTFAFRRPNGKLSTGQRARIAMEADPENVVLVSRKSLDDAMRMSRDLPEGELPDNPLRAVDTFEGVEGLARVRELGDRANDLVAFPKAAIEGMRQGWEGISGGTIKAFDTPQQLWKRGILSFAPRWYVNSLVGNTLQYGLLTGGDVVSIFQARRSRLGEAVPERVSGSTNVAEARISDPRNAPRTAGMRGYMKASDVGMEFQGKLDALFRRAAYISSVKKGIRAEGGQFRRLSPDEKIAALENAPAAVKNQAIRDVELFLGNYVRMSPLERATLRRVFPFWSWMRTVGKIMFVVPVKHPKRTAILSLVARASADTLNEDDPYQRVLANRGRINVGDYSMRTAGANPLFTHADLAKNIAGGDVKDAAGAIASNASPIGLQQFLRNYSGTTGLGVPVSYPPGYGGTASQYGRSTMRIDPVTGLPDYFEPSVPLSEQILQTIPLAPQLVRGVASGGKQPYDTTTTLDLLTRSKPDSELFQPKRDRAMTPIPGLGPFLGLSGLNFQKRDRAKEMATYRKALADFKAAVAQTERRKRKASR